MSGAAVSDALRTPGGALLAALSREVREPLQSMTAWLALLAAQADDPSDDPAVVRRAVRALEQIVRQQAELADDLMEVSRLATGRMAISRTRTDAAAVVRESVERHRDAAHSEGVELRFEGPGAPLEVAADEARLRQAMDRLLRAAIRRTPANRSVSVRVGAAGPVGEIVVCDAAGESGAPDIPALSERSDPGVGAPRNGRGGLGLVLARQLVEAQGGEITACAGPGATGATFSIQLPLWRDGAPALLHSQPPERVLDDVRVLVVDDDQTVLEALSQVLVAYGARVAVAPSAAAALERLLGETFDAVCSDLDMPGGSGLTLARALRVRETSGHRRLPLVAVTGQAGDEPELSARQAGFDAYLVKPVAVATLARCLRMLIDRERGSQAVHR